MPSDPIPALKRQLADELLSSVADLNRSVAATVLEIDDARMSDLRHGRIARFSVERLIRLLVMVDRRVSLTVVNEGPPSVRWFRKVLERRARTVEDRPRRGEPRA